MKNRLNYAVLETIYRSQALLHTNLELIFKDFGLTGSEFGIMEAIHSLGSQPIQILAYRSLLSSGGMTYTKKQLIKKI